MTANQLNEKLENYIEEHNSELVLPYILDFCLEVGMTKEALEEAGKRYPRTIGRNLVRMDMQRENLLQRGGLNKTLDRAFATFCLKQMGWKDTAETEARHTINFNGDIEKWAK